MWAGRLGGKGYDVMHPHVLLLCVVHRDKGTHFPLQAMQDTYVPMGRAGVHVGRKTWGERL